jgi:hypothetical protein
MNNKKSKKKTIGIVVTFIVITLVLISGVGYFYYGIGMSDDNKIMSLRKKVEKREYNKAREINDRYFKGKDQASKAYHELNDGLIDICEKTKSTTFQQAFDSLEK